MTDLTYASIIRHTESDFHNEIIIKTLIKTQLPLKRLKVTNNSGLWLISLTKSIYVQNLAIIIDSFTTFKLWAHGSIDKNSARQFGCVQIIG